MIDPDSAMPDTDQSNPNGATTGKAPPEELDSKVDRLLAEMDAACDQLKQELDAHDAKDDPELAEILAAGGIVDDEGESVTGAFGAAEDNAQADAADTKEQDSEEQDTKDPDTAQVTGSDLGSDLELEPEPDPELDPKPDPEPKARTEQSADPGPID